MNEGKLAVAKTETKSTTVSNFTSSPFNVLLLTQSTTTIAREIKNFENSIYKMPFDVRNYWTIFYLN